MGCWCWGWGLWCIACMVFKDVVFRPRYTKVLAWFCALESSVQDGWMDECVGRSEERGTCSYWLLDVYYARSYLYAVL